MPEQHSVFVLIPFEEPFHDVYDGLIKPPLEDLGFVVRRADSLFNQQQILKDVVKGIADATLVIADVTGLNGNVLYEMGLAHALGKRTVIITQQLEELPFDLRPYRAHEYSMLFNKADELRSLLRGIGDAVLANNADFSNPVQDFAPYALRRGTQVASTHSVGELGSRAQDDSSDEADDSEPGEDDDDEPGLLERLLGLQQGGEATVGVATKIGELTEEIGKKFSAHSERLNRAKEDLGDRALGAQLGIARDAANDLERYGGEMKPLAAELQSALAGVTAGADSIAREGAINDDEDAQAVEELLQTLRTAEAEMAEGRQGMEGFAQAMLDMPNIEHRLRRAAKWAAGVVMATAEEIESGESGFARARGLLQERLEAYRKRTLT